MNVIPDELSKEALRFVIEVFSDTREPVMSFAGYFEGIATGRLPIDQALHFIASGCA